MTDTYKVTAPGVIVNLTGAPSIQLLRDAVLPSNVDPQHLQHLLDSELVEKVGGSEEAGGHGVLYDGAGDPVNTEEDDGTDSPANRRRRTRNAARANAAGVSSDTPAVQPDGKHESQS